MGRMPSLPDNPQLQHVFKRFPEGMWELCEFHDIKLRGDSPLSVAQRELIAAYVSGLNKCEYCLGAHRTMAEVHGIDSTVFDKIFINPAEAGVDIKMQPILDYVKKLTDDPHSVTDADARAVYDAGWDEQALFDAVVVCALFNFMNRIIEGTGIVPKQDAENQQLRKWLEKTRDSVETYRDFARQAGVAKE